ncbi:MAG: hypothetical protein CUN48_19970, partial [Candidatus Thermofonsia Clade 3 bacterium]
LLILLLAPSFVGGLLGALLLTRTPPELFGRIVPLLVLFATLIFAARDAFNRMAARSVEAMRRADDGHVSLGARIWGILFQLFVAT